MSCKLYVAYSNNDDLFLSCYSVFNVYRVLFCDLCLPNEMLRFSRAETIEIRVTNAKYKAVVTRLNQSCARICI